MKYIITVLSVILFNSLFAAISFNAIGFWFLLVTFPVASSMIPLFMYWNKVDNR